MVKLGVVADFIGISLDSTYFTIKLAHKKAEGRLYWTHLKAVFSSLSSNLLYMKCWRCHKVFRHISIPTNLRTETEVCVGNIGPHDPSIVDVGAGSVSQKIQEAQGNDDDNTKHSAQSLGRSLPTTTCVSTCSLWTSWSRTAEIAASWVRCSLKKEQSLWGIWESW